MADTIRMRVTITYEYDANPAFYTAKTPEQMAKDDEASFDPEYLYNHSEDPSFSVTIVPAKSVTIVPASVTIVPAKD